MIILFTLYYVFIYFILAHVAGTYNSTPEAQKLTQPLWSGETHLVYSDAQAACWAQTINQDYVQGCIFYIFISLQNILLLLN